MLQNGWKCIFIYDKRVLILFNKVENVYAYVLSVCPSVCERSNYRKHPSNVLRFLYTIYTCYRKEHIENVMYGAKSSCYRGTQKFSDPLLRMEEGRNFKFDYNIFLLR